MKATLTLDDDVAMLLNRARRSQGRSLEETGNDLLRRTLRSLGLSSPTGPDDACALASGSADEADRNLPDPVLVLEAKIDHLYGELRGLVARSADHPGLVDDVERTQREIQVLQAEEAELLEERARARRHLKPGEGYRILKRAESLLER